MITKQNLWFVTLFSLIVILSVYYINLDSNDIAVMNSATSYEDVVINEDDSLVAIKVSEDEAYLEKLVNYQDILLDSTKTLDEKNDAYENIQVMNEEKALKEKIQNMIMEDFSLNSVVSLNKNDINITISSTKHDKSLANEIISKVQENFNEQKYITIKFK